MKILPNKMHDHGSAAGYMDLDKSTYACQGF